MIERRQTIIDNEDGTLEIQKVEGEVLIHLSLNKWTKEKYKEYLVIFESFLLELKESGVGRVFVCIPSSNKKLVKFEKLFGFKELLEEDGNLLMYRKIGD